MSLEKDWISVQMGINPDKPVFPDRYLCHNLTLAHGTLRRNESWERLNFSSNGGCIYSRKSSCDLLAPLYFRCCNWQLLVGSPDDWLVSNPSRTFRCLSVLGFSHSVPSSFSSRDQHHVIATTCLVTSAGVLMTLSLGWLEVNVLG